MTGNRYDLFNDNVKKFIVSGRIAGVKLWGPDKTVVYSLDRQSVGSKYPYNEKIDRAMKGETINDILSSDELKAENEEFSSSVIETYTPVFFPGNNQPNGVMEIYEYYTPILSLINTTRFRIFAILDIVFVMLYAILVGFAWNGWRTVIKQRQDRRRAEDLFQTLSENSPVGIFVIGDGKFQFVNPQFEKDTGYNKNELMGMNSLKLVFPDDNYAVREKAVKMLKGQRSNPYEYRLIDKAGNMRWVMESVVSIDYGGKRAALGYYMDITELKLTEKALTDADEKLRQSQKMEAVGRLAGGVAHDFNNILTVITLCSDMLIEKIGENTALRKDVEDIRRASDQATNLTKRLLILSRKRIQQAEVLDINSIVDDMKKMLQRLTGENCQLETILEAEQQSIRADRSDIEQIIMNLVVNAHDAMPRGGEATIKTENLTLHEKDIASFNDAKPGTFVRLTVADNGIGMSKDILDHMFEPFFTTKEKGKGTGLGLSTVYSIVKHSGGWINVYSEVGKGSRFSIYLPVCQPIECKNTTSKMMDAHKNIRGDGERILLVEDEEKILDLTRRMLTENGYAVFAAKSVEEALEAFVNESGKFHLVFSDVVLPDGSGVEFVGQIEKLNPKLHFLLTSGYADEKAQFSLIKERGWPFIQKPYKIELLLQKIGETLSVDKECNSELILHHSAV